MQPALGLGFDLPPPASGAFRLAGGDRPRAGRAADRGETLGVQRIDRNIVGGDQGEELLARPIEQRIELEQAGECTPLANITARGLNALLLARAYASHEDYSGFERAIANAEALARHSTTPSPPLPLFSLGFVYEECVAIYAKSGQPEKSQRYLQLAEQALPANNLCMLLLKVDRAEMLIYSGDIMQAMPLLIEVAHLAQMYGHQHLIERLHRLQYYLDDQSLLMRQASRNLGELLHGRGEY